MLTISVAVAALVVAAEPVLVVCPGFTAEGVSAQTANAMLDRFASELARGGGIKVITQRDIQQLLGLERQKQLIGCDDGAGSCIAELQSALGAQVVVTGSIVKVGTRFTLTLRALRTSGDPLVSESVRLEDADALSDWFDAQARSIRGKLVDYYDTRAPVAPWVVTGVGAVAAISGGVVFALSKGDVATLKNPAPDTNVDAVVSAGRTKELVGITALTVGGAAVIGGLLWGVLSRPSPRSEVRVALGPTGIVVWGALP